MVTREQIKNGIIKYADQEIIPNLPTYAKWLVGGTIILGAQQFDSYFNAFCDSPYVQPFGIIAEDNRIDDDKLFSALIESARRYGKMCINVPVVGALYFDEKDLAKLKAIIESEGSA